jgi:hypothetical protein
MEPDRRANKQIHPSLPVGVSPAAYGGCLSDESQTLLWRKSDSSFGRKLTAVVEGHFH